MKVFEDYDPVFELGDGGFILLNLGVGACVGWFAAAWLPGTALVVAWSLLRTLLSWLRDSHLPFLARVMARGEHGAVHPTVAHYLGVLVATIFGTAVGALVAAAVHRTLR